MSDSDPFVVPEMDSSLRKQIQECNWQVVNVTTPANYFHVLRRQVRRQRLRLCFLAKLQTMFQISSDTCLLFTPDTQGVPEASSSDVSEEPASPQVLQVKSVRI